MLSWQRRDIYFRLMRTDRPIGTYLVVWPALWALWFAAGGLPPLYLVLVFIAGAFLMRSAGCVINDYADRDFDPQVNRTKNRPLAQNAIPPREALQLFLLLAVFAASLLLFTNQLTVLLALVAVLLAAFYPFTKRFLPVPQLVLGLAFSWAVPMAFAAASGKVPPIAWLLLLGVIAWVVAYDTFYAMVDRPDDLKAGIKSSAIFFGGADRAMTFALQLIFLASLVAVGIQASRGVVYFLSLCVAAVFLAYQQLLVSDRDGEKCFRAFLNNNYVGLVVFLGIALDFVAS